MHVHARLGHSQQPTFKVSCGMALAWLGFPESHVSIVSVQRLLLGQIYLNVPGPQEHINMLIRANRRHDAQAMIAVATGNPVALPALLDLSAALYHGSANDLLNAAPRTVLKGVPQLLTLQRSNIFPFTQSRWHA